jgi:hypothetical protein
MKSLLKLVLTICLFGIINAASAQKKPFYSEQGEIIEAANKSLDNSMKSGDLKDWATKYNITGNYTLNLTIGGKKGEVITVSTVERSEDASVKQQNSVKNHIKLLRFPFKMPKGKSYQFEYEFKF